MPILKPRYNYTKVFRPSGTKFAYADCPFAGNSGVDIAGGVALSFAYRKFREEFGRDPERMRTEVEVTFFDRKASAVVYELPE